MKTRHVPDLEHCQELDRLCKEKGIEVPETEYVWYERYQHQTGNWTIAESTPENFVAGAMLIPAPLVSEQGEWLPNTHQQYKYYKRHNGQWVCRFDYGTSPTGVHMEEADTEANARQKMLNYLIAEGIITKL